MAALSSMDDAEAAGDFDSLEEQVDEIAESKKQEENQLSVQGLKEKQDVKLKYKFE